MGSLGQCFAIWAQSEPSVHVLILLGSRVRSAADPVWKADEHSDWDFHLVTSRPRMFDDRRWLAGIPGLQDYAYVARRTTIGKATKISMVTNRGEVDLVVVPLIERRMTNLLLHLGLHKREGRVRQAFRGLAVVIRPGYLFLKGERAWSRFYHRVVNEVRDPRLEDSHLCALMEGFWCDYVSCLRKIDRGEFIAAQRLLHGSLAEVNFRLIHELRLRGGERSFPDARRVEFLLSPWEKESITVDARPAEASLRVALRRTGKNCCDLASRLLGDKEVAPKIPWIEL